MLQSAMCALLLCSMVAAGAEVVGWEDLGTAYLLLAVRWGALGALTVLLVD
jgi:hypothetical protein